MALTHRCDLAHSTKLIILKCVPCGGILVRCSKIHPELGHFEGAAFAGELL